MDRHLNDNIYAILCNDKKQKLSVKKKKLLLGTPFFYGTKPEETLSSIFCTVPGSNQ